MAAPSAPTTPSPANGTTGVSVTPALTWTAPGATSCWVYGAGHHPDPLQRPVPISDLRWPGPSGNPGSHNISRSGRGILVGDTWTFDENSGDVPSGPLSQLAHVLQFSWTVIAINGDGMTAGPIWNFTTGNATPNTPSPSTAGRSVNLSPTLSWSALGATTYDVYFGTTSPPSLVSTGQAPSTYTPAGPLVDGTVYFWQIVAHGPTSLTGPIWSFTARPYAPAAAPVLTLAAGSALGVGVYQYAVTFVTDAGESVPSPLATITTGATPTPSAAPTVTGAPVTGAIPDIGAHDYAYTFVTPTGETTPSPLGSITTAATVAAPSVAPTIAAYAPAGFLTPGETYYWKYTYSTHPTNSESHAQETTPSAASTAFVCGASGAALITWTPSADPAVKWVHLYRTVGDDASTYYYERSGVNTPPGTTSGVGDAFITANPVAPGSDTSVAGGVTLTAIAAGPSPTTSRKVYRTAAGGSQLKLAATIADNTTTSYEDHTTDAGLGANAPTVNTAGHHQMAVSAIAVGPPFTTQRKVYRTVVAGAQLKLLTTIANNTATTHTDSTVDGSLGANAPTVDTSGLG